eukprot:XP_015571641.1 leucine-rich repeat extensin-like protein 4 isoform X2 [Ricinus communis]
MEKSWLLAFLLLFQLMEKGATFGVSAGVGIGIGNAGGGGVWIGGGINIPNPTPSGSSVSNLNNAYTALQAWKSAITDDPSKILDTWVGTNVCSYKGIFCAVPRGDDRYAASTGPVVSVTLYIPNLVYLDLRFNSFSGPVPDDLFNKGLDAILLNNNQFDGQIPDNLGNSPASVINLANNKFSGTLPASFGIMSSKLKEILFLNNQLTGCIPESVGMFTDMEVLDVSQNALMGHLPDSISCLSQIEVLNLAHNKFSGVLPDLVCSLKSLLNLTVAYNFFSGFSQECARLFIRNVGFDFSLNCIPGRNMQRPQPDCSVAPGGGLSCLRIPAVQPLVCGSLGVTVDVSLGPSSP